MKVSMDSLQTTIVPTMKNTEVYDFIARKQTPIKRRYGRYSTNPNSFLQSLFMRSAGDSTGGKRPQTDQKDEEEGRKDGESPSKRRKLHLLDAQLQSYETDDSM